MAGRRGRDAGTNTFPPLSIGPRRGEEGPALIRMAGPYRCRARREEPGESLGRGTHQEKIERGMSRQRSLEMLSRISKGLESFKHETAFVGGAAGPICRWDYDGLTVDVMPTDGKILGFNNRWYSDGLK